MTALDHLYDSLSRYHWWRRSLRRPAAGEGLELHKRLAPPTQGQGPAAGSAPLNRWLLELCAPPPDAAVLDIGCGFGATLLSWASQRSGSYVGLSPSRFQLGKATAEAKRLGLAERCRFRAQSYADPIEGGFDVVLSVESLFHAANLREVIQNVARSLPPGGRLLLLEDMAREQAICATTEARELLRLWRSPSLHCVSDYTDALETARLEIQKDLDLSPQVPLRTPEALDRSWRRLQRCRTITPLPGARRVLDAFLGGICLERLYARGHMRYRAMLARRPA